MYTFEIGETVCDVCGCQRDDHMWIEERVSGEPYHFCCYACYNEFDEQRNRRI